MTTQTTLRTAVLSFFLTAFGAFAASAQQTVSASDIMDAIKKGEDVNYSNVTVTGILDFTFMEEKEGDLPRRRRWWRDGGDNTVNEEIESKVTFNNVTFQDDVIAYFHNDRTEDTFTADFEQAVKFENCNFKRDVMFKYSVFEEEQSLVALSLMARVLSNMLNSKKKPIFLNHSLVMTQFSYPKFRDGASFNAAKFDRSLDMKYTKVRGDLTSKTWT